jgi:hypothetical protein
MECPDFAAAVASADAQHGLPGAIRSIAIAAAVVAGYRVRLPTHNAMRGRSTDRAARAIATMVHRIARRGNADHT